jgi:hypothetical protein
MTDETKLQVSVQLTPEQIAEAWWGLGSDEQALFFAHLFAISGEGIALDMQCMDIRRQCLIRGGGAIDAARAIAAGIYRFGDLHEQASPWWLDPEANAAKRGIAKMADAARATH